eukprot:CAMPEP_0194164854 /NCGR_PEP_ID=MMETSP0154-20130528/924_1 /TAXON_ID=1049557 /ORGANISM="Thalassiothrix antarctica, Strain L6-D1" /LENGTH=566 /DNA_ID=CAMNT_0038875149 /DNA_START=76 /DNA_END=1772 /DNA_ORIENTATION=-
MTCLNGVRAIRYIIFFFLLIGNSQGDDNNSPVISPTAFSPAETPVGSPSRPSSPVVNNSPAEAPNSPVGAPKSPVGVPTDESSFSPSSVPTLSLEPTTTAAPTIDCTCCNCTHSSGCNPDPHYFSWDNSYFDFQGGCDQIAIDNPQLQLQIRTRPRNGWSTVTEVALLMKNSGEFFRYSVNPGPGGFPDLTNTITSANSNADCVTISRGHQINFLQDPGARIRITDYFGNINVQIVGTGLTFTDSEGMFGSWNYGGVRFRNGLPYDTSGGFVGTRPTSIALAQDWQIPIADNLMSNPSNICEYEPNCANSQFGCSSTTRKLESVDCDQTCDDIGSDPTGLAKLACEEDFAITGDNFFACQPAYQDPFIILADPSDFDPGNAPCNNSPPNEVEEALDEELSSSGTRRSLSQGLRGRSLPLGNGFSLGNNNNNGGDFSYGNGNQFGKGLSFGNDNEYGKGLSFGNGDNAGKGLSFGNGDYSGKGLSFGNGDYSGKGLSLGNGNEYGKGLSFGNGNYAGKGLSFGNGNYAGKGLSFENENNFGKGFNFGEGNEFGHSFGKGSSFDQGFP